MSLLFVEGFDHYEDNVVSAVNISTVLSRKWASNNGQWFTAVSRYQTDLVAGDMAAGNFGSGRTIITPTLSGPPSTIVVGWAFKPTASTSIAQILDLNDNNSIVQLRLHRSNAGNLILNRGSGTFLGNGSRILHQESWYYIEIKAFIDNTTGYYEVRVNGQTDFSDTNVDTQATANANISNLEFLLGNGGAIDDMYVLDTNGSQNNDFLGDIRVQTLFADGAGTTTEWNVTGAASNYQAIDEIEADDDTSYVNSTTATDLDTYTYEDLSTSTESVFGVVTNHLTRKDDAGAREIAPVIRSSSTNFDGTTVAVATGYEYITEFYDANPDGSTWTETNVNSAEFGTRLIT